MSERRVVFDRNVYAQTLLSPQGPAGACVRAGFNGNVVVCLSSFVISEIRVLPNKPTPARLGMTLDQVDELLEKLRPVVQIIEEPPVVFEHPIDPKDGPYIDLAVAAGATVIRSRDKHLLNLMNPAKPWSADFRAKFPQIRVLSPEAFLERLRAEINDEDQLETTCLLARLIRYTAGTASDRLTGSGTEPLKEMAALAGAYSVTPMLPLRAASTYDSAFSV